MLVRPSTPRFKATENMCSQKSAGEKLTIKKSQKKMPSFLRVFQRIDDASVFNTQLCEREKMSAGKFADERAVGLDCRNHAIDVM